MKGQRMMPMDEENKEEKEVACAKKVPNITKPVNRR